MCDRSELEALQAEYAGQLMALTFIIRQPSVNIAASLIRQTSDGSVTESFRKEAHEFSERRGYTARQSPNSRSKIMHQDPTDLSGRYRISRHAIDESERAFKEYEIEVETSGMALTSSKTYIIHADRFVRWLKREFQPGTHTGNRRPKRG